MSYKNQLLSIDEKFDSICYVTDIETNKILYTNELCSNLLKKASIDQVKKHLEKKLKLINKTLTINNKDICITYGFNLLKNEAIAELNNKLEMKETIIKCFKTLGNDSENDENFNKFLCVIGKYYDCSKVFIFELDYEKDIAKNTFEWCDNYTHAEINNLQAVPVSELIELLDNFLKYGESNIKIDLNYARNEFLQFILERGNVLQLLIVPLFSNGGLIGFVGVSNPKKNCDNSELLKEISYFIVDSLDKKRINAKLKKLNSTDSLTGLYNRNCYMEKLKSLEIEPPQKIGIIYGDINGLKQTNDTYGHIFGDFLIIKVSNILREFIGENLYRTGGDEFIGLCLNIEENEFEEKVNSLRQRFEEDDECKVAIGSIWKNNVSNILDDINYTDELMYADKQNFYKSAYSSSVKHRSNSAKELIKEIEAGLFVVFLQAKVDLKTGSIVGAEALIRKRDLRGNFISPASFISIYEYDRIIRHVDFFVLETVCETLAQWHKNGIKIKISINFSRISFMEYNLVEEITNICKHHNVSPEYIDIEITESIDKMDKEIIGKRITELKNSGFTISLDDFGASYSNLSMLTQSDFYQIKIDKSLVDNLTTNEKNIMIINNIIKIIDGLDETTSLAEGIETKEQLDILLNCNCQYGQGYYFYKPLPIDEFLNKYIENSEKSD